MIKLFLYKYFQRIVRRMAPFIPKREALVTFCTYYLDAYYGMNNTDMDTDGEIDFLKSNLSRQPGIKVFDIGANRGDWCDAVLRLNPHAEIHCFEPCASTFEHLKSKALPSNVICNNFALGARPEVKQMNVFKDNPEWNSLYARPCEGPQSVQEVRIDTVMDYCSRACIDYIEYMKIDVEGNEFAVLQGAADLLAQHKVHIIQFEYAATFVYAGTKLRDIFELADRWGYDMFRIRPRGVIPVPEFKPNLENFRNANYVMMCRDSINGDNH